MKVISYARWQICAYQIIISDRMTGRIRNSFFLFVSFSISNSLLQKREFKRFNNYLCHLLFLLLYFRLSKRHLGNLYYFLLSNVCLVLLLTNYWNYICHLVSYISLFTFYIPNRLFKDNLLKKNISVSSGVLHQSLHLTIL